MSRGASPDVANDETLASSDGSPGAVDPLALADTGIGGYDTAPASTQRTAAGAATGPRRGRYVLLALVGKGAMGEVYSGYDRELDRRVALKLLRPRPADDARGRARMQREAQALARLSHPNVVQVHDVGELDGRLFVAMEFIKGETLWTWQARHDPATPAGRRAIVDVYMQAGRGLAAAHAAGIVHRDFKPTNVLVGDDGRVRVVDFGLAAPGAAPEPDTPLGATHPDPAPDLTRTGAIVGTPAYMAPEQFLGAATDARTDVFALSVALHEALYGVTPFAGHSFAERQEAVVAGARSAAPEAAGVPSWLGAVVSRGLARDPADRYPTMEAMLAALADDPIARRRQRWQIAGRTVAAVALTAALIVLGLWIRERWRQDVAEALAAERLAAVELRIDAALAAGATAEAAQMFATFVDHPDHRGTAALGRAWLRRADQARARDDTPAAIDALAGAYLVATRPDDQAAALLGLGRVFRDEMRWPGLLLAVATLEQRRDGAVDPSQLLELRLDAQVARRDLAGATALLRGPLADSPRAALVPVLAALQAATATDHHHRGSAVVADLDGDGRPELALETAARDRQIAPLLRAEPDLPVITTLDLGTGRFRALEPGPGQPALLVTLEPRPLDSDAQRDAVLRRWQAGALVEVMRWTEDNILTTLSADLDGDGERELLVGTGPYTRRVRELVRGADGSWSTRSPAPALDRRRSDVVALLADDFDGDGLVEVVAALGPWTAYELHVVRHDPASDTLRTVTRHRLGNIAGAATLRRGGPGSPPEIAVSTTDEYHNPAVFPVDRPLGEPAGVYRFRLVAGALVQTAFTPAPRLPGGARVVLGPPLVGDLDGDGRGELIVGCSVADDASAAERDATLIFAGAGDDASAPLVLGAMRPIAALDLDRDGDDELIVSDSAAADADRVWVLGSGAAAPPTIEPNLPAPADAEPPADPALARTRRRADELAQMGLVRQAAESLTTTADLVAEPEARAHALMRAAELQDSLDADTRAAGLFARAAEVDTLALAAHGAAARAYLRSGRFDAAAASLAAARAVGEPPPAVAAALAALRDGSGVDLDFDRPLDPGWRIDQPLAVRRDGARGSLHVDAILPGPLISAPVRWPGHALALTVDLDLARVEWRSGMEVGLVRAGAGLHDGGSPLGIDITTTGGGAAERTHEIACMSYGRRSVARIPHRVGDSEARLGRFTIRAILLPELGEWTCEVQRIGGASLHYSRNQLAVEAREDGPLRLVVAASRSPDEWVEAEIERLVLAGASVVPEPVDATLDPALLDARRAMVEVDPNAALAALARASAPTPADRLMHAALLARLGRLAEAEPILAALLADPATAEALSFPLQALLRTDTAAFTALVRAAAGPAELRARLTASQLLPMIMEDDPHSYMTTWLGLADIDHDTDPYDPLKLHAYAAARLGHVAAAQAGFRAALRALGDPARRRGMSGPLLVTEVESMHFELAALALAAGDEAAARRELEPLVSGPDADLRAGDRLRARADLRALHDLAPR